MPSWGWTILAPWLVVPWTDTTGGFVVVVVGRVVVVDALVDGRVVLEVLPASLDGSLEHAATRTTDATARASSTRRGRHVQVVAMVPSLGTIGQLPKSATLCGRSDIAADRDRVASPADGRRRAPRGPLRGRSADRHDHDRPPAAPQRAVVGRDPRAASGLRVGQDRRLGARHRPDRRR